jgi:hypothetical protein
MLEDLKEGLPRHVLASARWPKSPSMLSNELRRLAPALREHGLYVAFTRTMEARRITITSQKAVYEALCRQSAKPL